VTVRFAAAGPAAGTSLVQKRAGRLRKSRLSPRRLDIETHPEGLGQQVAVRVD